ncbi:MAG TPA: alpha/beta hydrolase [Geothrix sp.]|jgi:pimeloyl-ACP methyl ester carboxylesterase
MTLPAPERPLLVLLPGMDGTGIMFEPFLKALADSGFETRVVRYPAGLASYPACLHYARTQLPKERPFLLLAESFSGPVALALAAEEPEGRLVGLVLCGSFAKNPRPGLAWATPLLRVLPARRLPRTLIRFLLLGRWKSGPLGSLVDTMLPQVPPATLKGRLLAVGTIDQTALLRHIRVPILALVAAHDRLVPLTATHWLRAHLPTMDIARLQGPHWLLQTRPDAALQAITAFLDRLPKPEPGDGRQ